MKNFTLIFSLITFSLGVSASDCLIKETTKTGKVLVLPHYEATVNYFFNKMLKEAFATVAWSLNETKTRACYNEAKTLYSPREVVIPRSSAGQLMVNVLLGEKEVSLNIFPQANGHFFGDSESIKIPYSKKRDVEAALARGDWMVEVTGDLSFTTTVEEPRVLTSINCSEENQDAGILNLLKRTKELEAQVMKLQSRGKINLEEVMEEFFGTCVTFREVEAGSFEELDRQQRVSSSLSREKFSVIGLVSILKSEPLPGVAGQKVTIFDI